MTARIDSFEGLHVLLVTEDEARAQAIAKSLRERKAHVGDVRAGAKDPVAMRGADLLVIDARRAPTTEARVAEVRSDVRARWASVASIDYTTLASGDGTVDLRALEGIVSRLAGMDKALTERARKEASFETTLAPLGPTRTLRALALAGPTLHVELTDGELTAKVDLADELLVAAFAERKSERWDAWQALAHVLGMTDANVVVTHRAHPSAMNIMEPVDQALENAAQERVRTPELFEEHVEELSGLRGDRRESFADLADIAVGAGSSAASHSLPIAKGASPSSSTAMPSAPASAQRARGLISVPPPAAAAVLPRARPSMPFADVPTDPAAPGLLQRMARAPANDASDKASAKPAAPEPVLSIERDHDDDSFEGEEEYDQGEVTVVADASQLDILRETLGRLDAPQGKGPLTSTMPAPRGPNAESDELELVQALQGAGDATAPIDFEKANGAHASQPTSTPPKPSAPATSTPPTSSTPSTSGATSSTPAVRSGAPTAARTPTLRLEASDHVRESKPAGKSSARTWILVALVLMALAAVSAMLWQQQQNRVGGAGSPATPDAPAAVNR